MTELFYPLCFNQDTYPVTHVLNCGMIFIPFSVTNFHIQVANSEFFVHMNKKICRTDNLLQSLEM